MQSNRMKKRKYMKKVILFLAFYVTPLYCELPEPYCSINVLPFEKQYFFMNHNTLARLIAKVNPMIIVEVGSWTGASTTFMAQRMPSGGKLYAVDTWLGSPQELHHTYSFFPYLYQQFLSNVIHAGVADKIIPIRMNSIEASKALNVKIDLCYLDAGHDTKSVMQDILAWYPRLNPN